MLINNKSLILQISLNATNIPKQVAFIVIISKCFF